MGRHSKPELTATQVDRVRQALRDDDIDYKDIVKRFNISKDKLRAYRKEMADEPEKDNR